MFPIPASACILPSSSRSHPITRCRCRLIFEFSTFSEDGKSTRIPAMSRRTLDIALLPTFRNERGEKNLSSLFWWEGVSSYTNYITTGYVTTKVHAIVPATRSTHQEPAQHQARRQRIPTYRHESSNEPLQLHLHQKL